MQAIGGQDIRIDIDGGIDGAPCWIGATIYLPAGCCDIAMFCFPGGGMMRRYFDLRNASFARAMAARGIATVMFDHLGTGDSAGVADGFALTATSVARAGAAAVAAMARQLREGGGAADVAPMPALTLVGVGHSMGGMIVSLQQAVARPYAALALLGFSTRGLPEILTPDEQAVAGRADRTDADYVRLARSRFGGAFADIPARGQGSAALQAASGPLLTVAAMQSMLPGNIAPQAAAIDVPVFIAVGDRDMTGRPERIPAAFSSAPSVRLFVLADAGHHPFVAASAENLYAALAEWARSIASGA